jgi:hypothetical protein
MNPRTGRRRALPPWRRRPADDRGAIVILVAVVLSCGVLLGMGALVVDVGQMWSERQRLQSAADAAAAAVAQACGATVSTACDNPDGVADQSANDNSDNVGAHVSAICFSDPAKAAPCPTDRHNFTECVEKRNPASGEYWVQVYTETGTSEGRGVLPPYFGRVVLGDRYEAATIGACSRSYYTKVSTPVGDTPYWSKAILISQCEWAYLTDNGANPYKYAEPSTAAKVTVFHLHQQHVAGSATAGCPPNPADATPGGFDFLPNLGNDKCHNWAPIGQTITARPVEDGERDCYGGLKASVDRKLALTFTLYDSVTGTPDNYQYHVVGAAGFVITGFKFADHDVPSVVGPSNLCPDPDDRCIYGYFSDKMLDPP